MLAVVLPAAPANDNLGLSVVGTLWRHITCNQSPVFTEMNFVGIGLFVCLVIKSTIGKSSEGRMNKEKITFHIQRAAKPRHIEKILNNVSEDDVFDAHLIVSNLLLDNYEIDHNAANRSLT